MGTDGSNRASSCAESANRRFLSVEAKSVANVDWRIIQSGDEANPTLVEPERTYVLQPGDAHFYDVGDSSLAETGWPDQIGPH